MSFFMKKSFPFIGEKEIGNLIQKENNHIWEFNENQHPWVDNTGETQPHPYEQVSQQE